MSKMQFVENMSKKLSYLETIRDIGASDKIIKIKERLIAKGKISKYELHEFVLWNDVRVLKLFNDDSMEKTMSHLKWEMDYCLEKMIDYSVYYPLNMDEQRLTNDC